MTARQVLIRSQAREKVLRGAAQVADAVRITLGPKSKSVLGGFPTRKLRELALSKQRGGVDFYPQPDFVHLDSGKVRFW